MPGFSPTDYAYEGTLEIDGTTLNTEYWMVGADDQGQGGLLQLLGGGMSTRGENRIVPGGAGVIPYPRRRTESSYSINLWLNGDVGSNIGEHYAYVAANLAYLIDIFVEHVGATYPDRHEAQLVLAGAPSVTYTALVQVLSITPERYHFDDQQAILHATMMLNVLGGRFLAS